jgi:uncharacterized protein
MERSNFREAIVDYIREQARPVDKFSHQARLYALARQIAGDAEYDDDVVFAAAWLHDLGVFVGHRPADPHELANWDHLAYVLRLAPGILERIGFPAEKIGSVCEAIRTHIPAAKPASFEAALVHDADILEQLGAVGILRTVSKVGRDTRFVRFSDALKLLRHNLENLPAQLQLESARRLVQPRVRALGEFLAAAEQEAGGVEW